MSIQQPTRRGFLASILALSAAPAIVKAESLMRVKVFVPPPPKLYVGETGRIDSFRFIEDELAHSFKYDKHHLRQGINHPTEYQLRLTEQIRNGGWKPGDFQQQVGRAKRDKQNKRVFLQTVPADVSKLWYDALIGKAK